MGFFGRKKDKEKEKEKKGGLFGWMKRKQADEPEREEQIVEPEPETDTDDVAAQMLAEREAARQAETEQWREEAEAEIAADQAEAAALAAKAAQDELLTEEEDSEADAEDEEDEDDEEPIAVTFQPEEAESEAEEAEPETVKVEPEAVAEPETVESEPEAVAEPETVETEPEEPQEPEKKKKKGFFEKIRDGLRKTKDSVIAKMQLVLNAFTKIDEDLFDQLEETMIMGDMGAETSIEICDQLRKRVKERGITDPKQIMGLIQEIIGEMLGEDQTLQLQTKPSVIMVIGVNGAGKTTTIGKLCHQLKEDGKKVIVAAADTFRAAAIDQLEVWTDRAGVETGETCRGV